MKNFILAHMPPIVKNTSISLYNSLLYKQRHSGLYKHWRDYYLKADRTSSSDLERECVRRLDEFLHYATENSTWYQAHKGKPLSEFPVLTKEDLINNLEKIKTLPERKGVVSLTGGTTGASLKVIYTHSDTQERFAILDHFRSQFGYHLGERTAWFSGKSLINDTDLQKEICFRDDFINNIRFFSTFHISERHFQIYWKALCDYSPRFIVGFPSSVYEICRMASERNLKAPNRVDCFFPTAETVTPDHRNLISKILGCNLIDQYASSEGAPFILQCHCGNYHIHPLTGIFEVVDEHLNPSKEGELLVTSFTTHGTPLIRYRIGDRIKLAEDHTVCPCGSAFPVVEQIFGRTSDFIYSEEKGKVNLGNISNCTKDIEGIQRFQIIQKEINAITVRVVGTQKFNSHQEVNFLKALKLRVGDSMQIDIKHVTDIPREKSGKYRIVINHTQGRLQDL